jgi:hypothetical protein
MRQVSGDDLAVAFLPTQDWQEKWTDRNRTQKYPTHFFLIMH